MSTLAADPAKAPLGGGATSGSDGMHRVGGGVPVPERKASGGEPPSATGAFVPRAAGSGGADSLLVGDLKEGSRHEFESRGSQGEMHISINALLKE